MQTLRFYAITDTAKHNAWKSAKTLLLQETKQQALDEAATNNNNDNDNNNDNISNNNSNSNSNSGSRSPNKGGYKPTSGLGVGAEITFTRADTLDTYGVVTRDLEVLFDLYLDPACKHMDGSPALVAKDVRLCDEGVSDAGCEGQQMGVLEAVFSRGGKYGYLRVVPSDEKLFWHSSGLAQYRSTAKGYKDKDKDKDKDKNKDKNKEESPSKEQVVVEEGDKEVPTLDPESGRGVACSQNELVEGAVVVFRIRRRGGLRTAVDIALLKDYDGTTTTGNGTGTDVEGMGQKQPESCVACVVPPTVAGAADGAGCVEFVLLDIVASENSRLQSQGQNQGQGGLSTRYWALQQAHALALQLSGGGRGGKGRDRGGLGLSGKIGQSERGKGWEKASLPEKEKAEKEKEKEGEEEEVTPASTSTSAPAVDIAANDVSSESEQGTKTADKKDKKKDHKTKGGGEEKSKGQSQSQSQDKVTISDARYFPALPRLSLPLLGGPKAGQAPLEVGTLVRCRVTADYLKSRQPLAVVDVTPYIASTSTTTTTTTTTTTINSEGKQGEEADNQAHNQADNQAEVVLPASGRLILRRGIINKLGARLQTSASAIFKGLTPGDRQTQAANSTGKSMFNFRT